MRVEFLGTAGYHPNERRHTTCVMIPSAGVVFDAGTAFFRVPQRLETPELHVFLSHSHLDHIIGLTYALTPMMLGQIKRVHLHATQETFDAVRDHLFANAVFPVMPDFVLHQLDGPVEIPGAGQMRHFLLKSHPGGSTGFRLDGPAGSLAFITDTIVDRSYVRFVEGVDLLIHECYFPDDLAEFADKTGHSHTSPVAELARDAKVGRLILTHIDPRRTDPDPIDLQKARSIFARTEVAEDLMVVEV